jgi:hypothetical protein
MVGRVAATRQPDPAVDDGEFTRPGADLHHLSALQVLRNRPQGIAGA